jgi:hypothetical protein
MSRTFLNIIYKDVESFKSSSERRNDKDTICCGLTFGLKIWIISKLVGVKEGENVFF